MTKVVLITEDSTTKEQEEKLNKVAALLERIVNSPEFGAQVCGYTWRKGKVLMRSFHQSSKTRLDVYKDIMSGSEVLSRDEDREIDIYVRVRPGKRGVLGWTHPSTKWQTVASWFMTEATLPAMVGNAMHEYMHKKGYKHDFKKTPYREHTAAYAVGYIARDLAKKFIKAEL